MFSIEVKLKVHNREVSWDKFANLFLIEAFRSIQNEIQVKAVPPVQPQPPVVQTAAPSEPRPRVVNLKEAARLLGVSSHTIRAYVNRRKIASVKIGRRVLIPMEAINELVQNGLRPAR